MNPLVELVSALVVVWEQVNADNTKARAVRCRPCRASRSS